MTTSRREASSPTVREGLVCCVVGQEQFALRTSDVRLIARAEDMQIDRAGARMGTLRHGRGTAAVYSLASLLGRSTASDTPGSHVVLTGGMRGPFGMLVDRVVRSANTGRIPVLPLPRAIVGPVPARWFEGLVQMGDLSCLALSPAGLEPDARTPQTPAAGPSAGAATALSRAAASHEVAVIFSSDALPFTGDAAFALSARQIAAVVQTLPSVPLPGAPRHVTSVAVWRGAAVPLLDFRTEGSGSAAGRSLIVRTSEGALVGFPVNADVAVHHVASTDALASAAQPFVKGVFVTGTQRVALLDIDALLAWKQCGFAAECAV